MALKLAIVRSDAKTWKPIDFGDLQQIGQGRRTFWLITLKLFDRLASNFIQWKRS